MKYAITINQAMKILENGGAVVLPTETVYGVFVSQRYGNKEDLFKIKRRSSNLKLAKYLNVKPKWIESNTILNKILPGPVSVIYEGQSYRFSSCRILQKIISVVGPLYGTSANLSGDMSVTIGSHSNLPLPTLDNGLTPYGFETTIVSLDDNKIYRHGIINLKNHFHSKEIVFDLKSKNRDSLFSSMLLKYCKNDDEKAKKFWYYMNLFKDQSISLLSGETYMTRALNLRLKKYI